MEQQAAQNPNLPHLHFHSNHFYTTRYPSHYQSPNPIPNLSIHTHQPRYTTRPAVYPYASVSSLAQSHGGGGGGFEAYQPHAGYYQDPNKVASVHNWLANGVSPHYGSTQYATGISIPPNEPVQIVPVSANSNLWPNPAVKPQGNKKTWKRLTQKTKVVQSVWCEVCQVECDTKEVLYKHRLGKKHKKNMDKLIEAAAPLPPVASQNPVIGPREKNPGGKEKGARKEDVAVEELEAKRRKVLEGGAAADAVRTCRICNVVCNSEVVFKYHLQGQKHLATMKKHALG